jgi:hypothetical protein
MDSAVNVKNEKNERSNSLVKLPPDDVIPTEEDYLAKE